MSSSWNHGKISRTAAEQLLVANGKDGAFLVRQSESVSDAHVLSLWYDGMVHHFRILRKENKFVVQASCTSGGSARLFTSLDEVIELFKQPDQGLPHELKNPIINEFNNGNDSVGDDTDEDELDEEEVDNIVGQTPELTDMSLSFLKKMTEMDTSWLGSHFCNCVGSYISGGFDRDGERSNTSKPGAGFQELIVNSAEGIKREIKEFLKRVAFLQQLLCTDDNLKKLVPTGLGSGSSAQSNDDVCAYDDFMQDLAKCVAGIKSLEMLAEKAHQEHASSMKDEHSQTRTFEVTSCGNFKTRSYLKVDITEGKLWFMKNENDSIDDSAVVEHDKILQLVKDMGTPKLTFKMAKGNREYLLKDTQAREHLCQLVQYMMNIHDPTKKELKLISIFVGTWNMGSASPPKIDSWLKCTGTGEMPKDHQIKDLVGHDIYVIGTQESSVGEATWVSKLKKLLKKQFKVDYYTVATQSLWGIKLVILSKPEHRNRISRVEKSSVKTGIANTLGNKGGVGIAFDFLSTSLCFINCHLTSGNEDVRKQRRQQNYIDILKGLNLGQKSAYDLTNQFHHVFWFGDLNYRIDMQYEEIMEAIKSMDYKKLSSEDQLKKEQDLEHVFANFHENDLLFPPTYRYKKGTRDTYEHIKVKRAGNRINVPSWCDRVLWRSFPELNVRQTSYGCTNDIVSSDHSPVFASFDVPITSQFVASPDEGRQKSQEPKPSCKFNIPYIKVKIKTVSKTDFYLEFHSVCLAASQKSKAGRPSGPWDPPRNVNSKPTLTTYLDWSNACSLPKLNPILDNPKYLREQHILIAVKSEAGDESYGECVISLKGHVFSTPQPFCSDLTHGGVKAGEIRGSMNILNTKQASSFKKPAVHAKPELGTRNNSATPHPRPFSCVAPNVTGTFPQPSSRSASLGRQSLQVGQTASDHNPLDASKISTYVTLADFSAGTPASNNSRDQTAETQSSAPPPLPAKTYPTSKTSSVPETVDAFLSKLELECYLSSLTENGFDELTFLDNITEEDLTNCGITDVVHVKKILNEVEHLRRVGALNS